MSLKLVIIVAVSRLPWHIPEDFKHFKKTTLGYPLIVGERTYTELGKPLPGRLNIVLSYDKNFSGTDLCTARNFTEAIKIAEETGKEKAFVIGGRMVFENALPFCDEMIISHLRMDGEGDIFFPVFNEAEWQIVKTDEREQFVITYYRHTKNKRVLELYG
ncbi:MAG: dihydrofolate reductase [Ignavibacteriales bacterium]|nr:dihydrofolate reductase [Ignavibacteriales bacterium]